MFLLNPNSWSVAFILAKINNGSPATDQLERRSWLVNSRRATNWNPKIYLFLIFALGNCSWEANLLVRFEDKDRRQIQKRLSCMLMGVSLKPVLSRFKIVTKIGGAQHETDRSWESRCRRGQQVSMKGEGGLANMPATSKEAWTVEEKKQKEKNQKRSEVGRWTERKSTQK